MTKNIYTQLLLAQAEFPPIKLDATNPHFKSKYASLPQVLSTVNPVLNKHGIIHFSIQEEGKKDVLVLHLFHPESETCIKSYVTLLNMQDMQKWSGSCTHAERKALLKMLGIDGDMDDDGNSVSLPDAKSQNTSNAVTQAFKAAPELPLEQIIILKDNLLNLWDMKKEAALDLDAVKGGRIEQYLSNDFMKPNDDGELIPIPVHDLIKIQTYLKGI